VSRVLLISTYELGAQPLGISSLAGALRLSGHEVKTADLAVEPLDDVAYSWPDAVCFSVPMHTALRLALAARSRLSVLRPELGACFFGLYADAARATRSPVANDLFVAGEALDAVTSWLEGAEPADGTTIVALGKTRLGRPSSARDLLHPLERYARLVVGDTERLVGTVESTRGCNHRCRHCPVPVVYQGRSRVIEVDAVAGEIDELVGLGARHIRFADPDFLNRPKHALSVANALHERHPDLSFDATIKVEHLLRHRELVADLADRGLAFVVSAFESTSDLVLDRLDKGHRCTDAAHAVRELRTHGVEIRPSFLPFTPWTTREDLVEILDFVARNDIVDNVDAVQYSIRLLIPPGSLLLGLDDETLRRALGDFDPDALSYSWRSPDPLLDELQGAVAALVEDLESRRTNAFDIYAGVRALVFETLGDVDPGPPPAEPPLGPPHAMRPRLTEAWFCCAEPTRAQLAAITPIAWSGARSSSG
jgi:radical SAM superfamily enzyme YgiQ (UPF0313 family)